MTAPKPTLPADTAARKEIPLARGVLDYFPAALAAVARLSKAGNDKHNPGQEMHHARGKSTDHADCIMRHLADRGTVDPEDGIRHSVKVAWRALALLQEELEAAGEAPLARGARLPERKTVSAADGEAMVAAARKASEAQWSGIQAGQMVALVDGPPPFEKAFERLQAERKRISTPPAATAQNPRAKRDTLGNIVFDDPPPAATAQNPECEDRPLLGQRGDCSTYDVGGLRRTWRGYACDSCTAFYQITDEQKKERR